MTKKTKSIIALTLISLSVFLSACGGSGPQLPNDLGTLPIVPGINEACKVFGC